MASASVAAPVHQRDARPFALILAALVILADRLSKLWIIHNLPAGHAITVIPRVFRITHVLNTGAAFSLFEGSKNPYIVRNALIGFSLIAVIAVLAMLWRTGRRLTVSTVAFALILGGALGNLYDRAVLHFVVDFLEVHIGTYHWPDFNIADSAIVIGACLLMLEALRPSKA
jgi:signal peptidase II